MTITSSYLHRIYDTGLFTKVIDRTLKIAMEIRDEFPYDVIAFSGHSGAAVAYTLSYRTGIPLICIRKPKDDSHYCAETGRIIEGFISFDSYIIVDDIISSGQTVRRIIKSIADKFDKAKCVGIVLYGKHMDEGFMHQFDGIKVYGSIYGEDR